MTDPLVSIITPAYNAGPYLGETISSVLAQTYTNWELIVVDDGSTDDTAAIARQYAANDTRIKYIHQANGRQGKARNTGIATSSGSYLAFLDADDLWLPNKLSIQVAGLQQADGIDLLFSQGYFKTGDDVKDYDAIVKPVWDINDLAILTDQNQVPILSVLVKKEAVLTVNGFTEDAEIQNLEDHHLWLKLLISGYKFRSIADKLFYYRIHPQQNTVLQPDLLKQRFYLYKDIYYLYNNQQVRKILINKLKWYIFNDTYYNQLLEVVRFHFDTKGPAIISYLFNSKFIRIKKLGFHLIKVYG